MKNWFQNKDWFGNSLVLPYGVGIVGMVGNELGKTPRLPILSQLDTSYHILQLFWNKKFWRVHKSLTTFRHHHPPHPTSLSPHLKCWVKLWLSLKQPLSIPREYKPRLYKYFLAYHKEASLKVPGFCKCMNKWCIWYEEFFMWFFKNMLQKQ